MSRFHSYIRTAQQLLGSYDGSQPFASFAKAFFAKEKKYGSTDRRQISALCYHYFRAAKALGNMPEAEKLVAATFLCETKTNRLLESLKPEWNALIALSAADKMQLLGNAFNKEKLFPFANELSAEIDQPLFTLSFLIQPCLFLRIRPGQEEKLLKKLVEKEIAYTSVNSNCLALPNGSKLEEVVQIDKEAVVQDYSSQATGTIMQQYLLGHLPHIHCWDCCAASGGKSIMLHDLRPDAILTVSDIRTSILHNLRLRFQDAGIRNYQSFVADVSKASVQLPGKKLFNLIIADVPCTGSGTWARTPEQLYFFKKEQIEIYARRQQQIAVNALPYLQPGGYLVYITCSVFRQENEAIVEGLMQRRKLVLLHMQYLKGYTLKADTLFIAIMQHI